MLYGKAIAIETGAILQQQSYNARIAGNEPLLLSRNAWGAQATQKTSICFSRSTDHVTPQLCKAVAEEHAVCMNILTARTSLSS